MTVFLHSSFHAKGKSENLHENIQRSSLFWDAHAPARLVGTTKKDAWWFPERVGNPLSSPRLYLLFGGDFSLARRGRSGRSGRGGSALCSHVDVCCLRGWPRCERRGTHGRVHWSVCTPVVRCGGGAPTFFPVNAVKCGGCSSEGADKSQGRLRSVARTEPSVPE